jgi:hypothetical protein
VYFGGSKDDFEQGDFLDIFSLYCIQHCIICRPSDSTVSEDSAIEPTELDLIYKDDYKHSDLRVSIYVGTECQCILYRISMCTTGQRVELPALVSS